NTGADEQVERRAQRGSSERERSARLRGQRAQPIGESSRQRHGFAVAPIPPTCELEREQGITTGRSSKLDEAGPRQLVAQTLPENDPELRHRQRRNVDGGDA